VIYNVSLLHRSFHCNCSNLPAVHVPIVTICRKPARIVITQVSFERHDANRCGQAAGMQWFRGPGTPVPAAAPVPVPVPSAASGSASGSATATAAPAASGSATAASKVVV
jgi:hypothetical protein